VFKSVAIISLGWIVAVSVGAQPSVEQTRQIQQQVQQQGQQQMREWQKEEMLIMQQADLDADIYGQELMTAVELDEYRITLRALKTIEAREGFRAQHRIKMQRRAQESGVILPDKPVGKIPSAVTPAISR